MFEDLEKWFVTILLNEAIGVFEKLEKKMEHVCAFYSAPESDRNG